jgi:hypothetical protein
VFLVPEERDCHTEEDGEGLTETEEETEGLTETEEDGEE